LYLLLLILMAPPNWTAPAGARPAAPRPGAGTVLPGGRLLTPHGRQHVTGPGPFGLAVSPSGRIVVSANGGPNRYSLTVLRKDKEYWRGQDFVAPAEDEPEAKENDWRSVFQGLAFDGEHTLYASEGNSGRVRVIDPAAGRVKRIYDLNGGDYRDSYTGDLAVDGERGLLYVLDQANFRMAVIDTRTHAAGASVRLGRLPFSLVLAPDRRKAYVTNIGMFQYRPVPGADPKQALETGLPFPAFAFPSPEAVGGARRETARGAVDVPGLGDPNAPESNSLAIVDLSNPEAPRLERFLRTGLPFGPESLGGSSPSGAAVGGGSVFVSNGHNDSISVIEAATGEARATIALRIPGLENLRGVLPVGLAWYEPERWLLVAEAGINAVGVIDAATMRVIGHIPAGWFPTRVSTSGQTVFVSNAKGHGTGPNTGVTVGQETFQASFRHGSVSIFTIPAAGDLARLTARVMENNGFTPSVEWMRPLPEALRRVVVIVKENRTFDEVFGDVTSASNGPVAGLPTIARFGRFGNVSSPQRALRQRTTLKSVNVTPNHHELAERWAFSDNFYADSEVSVDGHHWLAGSYPDAWTESSLMASYGGQKDFRLPTEAPGRLSFAGSNSSVMPEEQLEAGALWHHLERHGVSFRNFGEGMELAGVAEEPGEKPTGARYLTNAPMPEPLYRNTSRDYPQFNMNIPDQYRATQFISEIERRYGSGAEELPRFLFIHLPQDHTDKPRPGDGYPFEASYMADNDVALGRIIEYLSHSRWWREMAVFVTEDDAQGWVDHVDSHRTLLLAISPWARKNYASHVNASFPGLLKTAFRILGIPPLNLYDATAADLSDCFAAKPDYAPYKALPVDGRIFDPAKVKDPLDGPASDRRMDDPAFLREQHKNR
jgi:DNA-binding beta-propeller fold protein YncE